MATSVVPPPGFDEVQQGPPPGFEEVSVQPPAPTAAPQPQGKTLLQRSLEALSKPQADAAINTAAGIPNRPPTGAVIPRRSEFNLSPEVLPQGGASMSLGEPPAPKVSTVGRDQAWEVSRGPSLAVTPDDKVVPAATLPPETTGTIRGTSPAQEDDLRKLATDIRYGTGATAPGRFLKAIGAPGIAMGVPPGVSEIMGGPVIGPVEAGHGLGELFQPGRDVSAAQRIAGFNEAVGGALKTVAPALAMHPEFLAGLTKYGVGQAAISKAAQEMGADPQAAEAIANAILFYPAAKEAVGKMADIRGVDVKAPRATMTARTAFGGKVGAAAGATPEEFGGAVKIGPFRFEARIPRGPRAGALPEAPSPKPQTIPGEPGSVGPPEGFTEVPQPADIHTAAKAQQPETVKTAESIAAQVPGAKVVDPGAKSESAIERKQDGGRPVTDASRAQIVVPDQQAKQDAAQKIAQQLPTTEVKPIEAEHLPIVAAKLPDSQEIQVATEAEHKTQEATHDLYAKIQDAKAAGNDAEATKLQGQLDAELKEATQAVQPLPSLAKGQPVTADGQPGKISFASKRGFEKTRVKLDSGGTIEIPHAQVAKRIVSKPPQLAKGGLTQPVFSQENLTQKPPAAPQSAKTGELQGGVQGEKSPKAILDSVKDGDVLVAKDGSRWEVNSRFEKGPNGGGGYYSFISGVEDGYHVNYGIGGDYGDAHTREALKVADGATIERKGAASSPIEKPASIVPSQQHIDKAAPAVEAEGGEKGNWRTVYDSEGSNRQSILKAVANGKSTPTELQDALDRLRPLLKTTGAYDIAYDISVNKAASAETKAAAKALYESRYPPAPAVQQGGQAAESVGKQPWEMTRSEYELGRIQRMGVRGSGSPHTESIAQVKPKMAAGQGERVMLPDGHIWQYEGISGYSADNNARVNGWQDVTGDILDTVGHRQSVQRALESGKPVPPSVLADYPDLAAKQKPESPDKPGAVQGVVSSHDGSDKPPQRGAVAVDLDKTLAHYDEGQGISREIGKPIQAQVDAVKQMLADGKDVWIYTARAYDQGSIPGIKAWTKEHIGQELPVTNIKFPQFARFIDDRAELPKGEQNAGQGNHAPVQEGQTPQREAERPNRNQPETGNRNQAELRPEGGGGHPAAEGENLSGQAGAGGAPKADEGKELKYEYGSTQANIPQDSEAGRALMAARDRISAADLMPSGMGGDDSGLETSPHVTVRYGIQGEDTAAIREFLAKQAPFTATLGKTESFPPTKHSDGAAVIVAPIESPELQRINAEIEKHGDFAKSDFSEYRPHATVAYVKPDKAGRYTGMAVTEGKQFPVSEIAISKRDGSQENVKLGGGSEVPTSQTPEYKELKKRLETLEKKVSPAQKVKAAIAKTKAATNPIKERVAAAKTTPEKPAEAPPVPKGVAEQPWKMTREEYIADHPESKTADADYDRALNFARMDGKITDKEFDSKAIRNSMGVKEFWAKTRAEVEQEGKDAVRGGKAERADINKMTTGPAFAKWRVKSMSNTAKNSIESTRQYHAGLLDVHKERVQEALSEGKPVPANVLADYPDLAPNGGVEEAAAPAEAPEQLPLDTATLDEAHDRFKKLLDEAYKSSEKLAAMESVTPDEAEQLRRRFDRDTDAWRLLTQRAEEGRHLEDRIADNPGVVKVEPSAVVPRDGRNFEGRYLKAALAEVKSDPPQADSVFVKVPGDGKFVIPNNPSAIDRAIKAADKFVPPKPKGEGATKDFAMPAPTKEARLAYIKRLNDEISGGEVTGDAVQSNKDTITEIKKMIEADEGKNPLRKVGEKFPYTFPKTAMSDAATDHTVPAITTEVPGLIITTASKYGKNTYTITHEHTGLATGSDYKNPADAQRAVSAIAKAGIDWTKTTKDQMSKQFNKLTPAVQVALRILAKPVPSSYPGGSERPYRLEEGIAAMDTATAAKSGTPVENEKAASLKALITKADEAQLLKNGYTQEQIDHMTPEEAKGFLNPKPTTMGMTVPGMAEAAEFVPAAFKAAAGPLKNIIANEMGQKAEGIQRELAIVQRQENARRIRMGQEITKAFKDEGYKPEDGDAVRRNIESGAPLTPKQEELRDGYINPLREAARDNVTLYRMIESGKYDIEDLVNGNVPEEELAKYRPTGDGYLHRIAANHPSMIDWALGARGGAWGSRRNVLSKSFSASKRSVFQEARGPSGEREAVAVKSDRVTQFVPDQNGRIQTIDLGPFRSGFITTQEMADEAAAPLEKELKELKTKFHDLQSSPTKGAANDSRVEGLYYRIDNLEKQIAGLRASISPAAQKEADMTDAEVLAARREPIERRIAQLEKRAASDPKKAAKIQDQINEAKDSLSSVEDEFNSRANEGRWWRDKNGNLWQFNRGSSDFITERTGQKYHDNAMLSSTVNYLETSRAVNAAITVERQKAQLEAEGLSIKTDNPKDAPEGWKRTDLQQMRGYYFPAYIADAYNQFAENLARGEPGALERLNRFNLGVVLMNPIMHGKNVVANWITGKAAESLSTGRLFSPSAWMRNAKAGIKAVNDVVHVTPDYLAAMDNGLDLLRANPRFDNDQKAVLESLAQHFEKHPEDASVWQKALGLTEKAWDFLRHQNHAITFGISDVATLQAYYSALDRFKAMGLPEPETAARNFAHNQTMEYRPFVRFLGNRGIEKTLENPNLSAFWRYHSNLIRQIGQGIGDTLGTAFHEGEGGKNEYGESKNQARARGAAKLAFMALMATAIYPLVLDPLAKKITDNKKARAPRGGLLGTASEIADMISGQKTPFQVVHSLFTPALGTENLAQILSNTDFYKASSGYDARIVKRQKDAGTQAGQFGHWMLGRTLPGQMAQTEKFSPGTMGWRAAGFTFPKKAKPVHGTASWRKFTQALKGGK